VRKPIDSAIVLAISTAILYSWSTANFHGYLTTAKLDSDMMERSFHQVIYSGLVLSFGPILFALISYACALFVYSHAIFPCYIDYVRSGIGAKRKVVKFRRFWVGKRIAPAIERREKSRFNKVGVYTLLALLFIISLVYFEKKGSLQANEVLGNYLTNNEKSDGIIEVNINNTKKIMRFLACGEKNCAGIEVDSRRIYYFPQSSGFSFVYSK